MDLPKRIRWKPTGATLTRNDGPPFKHTHINSGGSIIETGEYYNYNHRISLDLIRKDPSQWEAL